MTATVNGAKGVVPSYRLVDLNTTFHVTNKYTFRLSVNNLMNKSYFTKRPTFYPGPGIWPSDRRSIVATVGVNI
nr:TonB-dependent receptor [Runella rosea]